MRHHRTWLCRGRGLFLARYSSKATVAAYALDLRLLFEWCAAQGVDPLDATRTHLELFARHLEDDRGNGPSSIHRRLSTIRCFYRIAEIDDYGHKSPAAHLRLPRVYRDETKTLGLDRVELGAVIAAARASTPSDAALITMMGLLGLRSAVASRLRVLRQNRPERRSPRARRQGASSYPMARTRLRDRAADPASRWATSGSPHGRAHVERRTTSSHRGRRRLARRDWSRPVRRGYGRRLTHLRAYPRDQ